MWAKVTSIGLKGMEGYRVNVEVGSYGVKKHGVRHHPRTNHSVCPRGVDGGEAIFK
ncbi:hypothetical protein [Neobacillus soli]|uniref:hypothetical protein n=1 Tax=Neobacillus soli TaxID=220688 RepID=UPI0012ED6386|nr:hypothetical protein [Neobacillus soli]